MKKHWDKKSKENSSKYYTGARCKKCHELPAGTAWSPYFCWKCNAERLDEIEKTLMIVAKGFK